MMILRFAWWYLVLMALIFAAGGCFYWAALRTSEPWTWAGAALMFLALVQWNRIGKDRSIYRTEIVREMARRDMRARFL